MRFIEISPRETLLIPDGWDVWTYKGVRYTKRRQWITRKPIESRPLLAAPVYCKPKRKFLSLYR